MVPTLWTATATETQGTPWTRPARIFHWISAATMAGATFLTADGDPGHAVLGWLALVALLGWHWGRRHTWRPSPTWWLLTVLLVAVNVSGWLAPDGTVHVGATLLALVVAALYGAAVLFEACHYLTALAGQTPER